MTQYISKDALVAEIERKIKSINSCPFRTAELGSEKLNEGQLNAYNEMLSCVDTLEVKEIEENEQPEYSSRETVYRCGKKPRFKVGDVVACYESYADFEREYEYGIVIKVEFDEEEEDWIYTFDRLRRENSMRFEHELVSDEAYAK